MDHGTLITAIVIITICVAPFILITRFRVRREKKILKELTGLATRNHCRITRHEFGRGFVIGVDEESQYTFFIKKHKEEMKEQYVDLKEVKACRLIEQYHTLKQAGNTINTIERLALGFTKTDPNQHEVVFEFYNEEEKMQLSGELQLLEKWNKIVNGILKKKKK